MASVATWAGSGALAAVGGSNQAAAALAGSGVFTGNVSTPQGPTIGSLVGSGTVSWSGAATSASVAALAGSGALAGAARGAPAGVAAWAGAGALAAVGASTAASVGALAGAGTLDWIKFANAPRVATMVGRGGFRAQGSWSAPPLPNPQMAWSIQIDGPTVANVIYDPISFTMHVYFTNAFGQYIVLNNLPINITNAIEQSPNPETYVLNLIR